MTKKQLVFKALKEHGALTIAQLSSFAYTSEGRKYISELRKEGHNIVDKWVKTPTSRVKLYEYRGV